jgi:hypothetical protein
MINKVDQSIYGIYSADFPSLNSYWHNEYDSRNDEAIEKKYNILFRIFMKIIAKNIRKHVLLVEQPFSQNKFSNNKVIFNKRQESNSFILRLNRNRQ